MPAQVVYNGDPQIGFAGQQADNSYIDVLSRVNSTGADQPFGIAVKQDPSDPSAYAALSSSNDEMLGLLMHQYTENASYPASVGNEGVKSRRYGSVARRGRFYVCPEQAVTPADPVFARVAGAQAQVATLTPTPANRTGYFVVVTAANGVSARYSFLSDSSATAAKIVAGLTALISSDPNAVVSASGSTTLILTAKTAGQGFSVVADANQAIAATTPNRSIGGFRKGYEGTAQVSTLTPTPVNSAQYTVNVNGFMYGYNADSSATAPEIVAGLTAAITADSDAVVAPSGSTTLILTAKTPGLPFTVFADSNISITPTTPNVSNVIPVANCKWRSSGAAGARAILEINLL